MWKAWDCPASCVSSSRAEHFNLNAKSKHAGNVREAYGYHENSTVSKVNPIENSPPSGYEVARYAISRSLASERHETVRSLVLPRPRLDYFNLDAKSEHVANVREACRYHDDSKVSTVASIGTRPPGILRIYKAHSRCGAGDMQTTRLRNAYQEHSRDCS